MAAIPHWNSVAEAPDPRFDSSTAGRICPAGARADRRRAWMIARAWLYATLSALVLSACGEERAQSGGSAGAAPAAQGPAELGEAVVATYLNAIDDSAELLADRPPSAQAQASFEPLLERHIQSLVALGRQIEKLRPDQRAQVEQAVRRVNTQLQYDADLKPRYNAYFDAVRHYSASDPEFGRRLQTVNILTQYAFFDLLRQQAPAEAERLGIAAPTKGVSR